MSTGQNGTLPFPRTRERGFSVIETLVGMSLMFVGLLALASSTTTGIATRETNRETASATDAARQFLEGLQTSEVPFEDLFRAYATDPGSAIPADDVRIQNAPPGLLAKAARGIIEGKSGELLAIQSPQFAVAGLRPRKGRSVASIGSVAFPVVRGIDGAELREDVAGRDLNGDGVIDSENHADDYRILPVTVKVEWKGTRGVRQLQIQSLLVRR